MKWPLVWRSTLEEARRQRDFASREAERATSTGQEVARYYAKAQEAIAQRDDTIRRFEIESTGRYVEIQRLNAELAKRDAPKPEPEVPEKSKLTEVIRDQARQPDGTIDRRLLSHLRGQANRLRREGMSEPDIAEAIQEWQTTERSDALTVEKIVAAFNEL